ncbi:MAG: sugar kinase [Chloroflexi bacterium]|nr:MAG: sugar kinase [Chloroflexota bacterium]TMG42322.1 MAG: sugar kinase [Chloroflexota bacterium]
MIKRLVSLGSVIVDLVLEVPRLPDRGGDVLASQRGMAAGGAFNVLSAAARLGLPGIYAGPHGTGPFGDLVRAALAREGVPTTMPPNPDLDTGWTLALVEPDGERTFVTVTGADALVTPAALRPTEYRGGDAVYVSGYDLAYPGAGAAIAEHVAGLAPELTVVLDPGPLAADIETGRLASVMRRVDILTLNARELGALGGLNTVLGQVRPTATVILRQGPDGATIHGVESRPVSVPSVSVKAVDTSGAGDVHVGASLAGLARGLGWANAVLLGNRAAAYAVSRPGPAAGPTDDQLQEFGASRW